MKKRLPFAKEYKDWNLVQGNKVTWFDEFKFNLFWGDGCLRRGAYCTSLWRQRYDLRFLQVVGSRFSNIPEKMTLADYLNIPNEEVFPSLGSLVVKEHFGEHKLFHHRCRPKPH